MAGFSTLKYSAFSGLISLSSRPVSILDTSTVVELLQTIKKCAFPVMYLPVLKNDGKAAGIVNFVHLIKGEL